MRPITIFDRDDLEKLGFRGFRSFADLQDDGTGTVPDIPGTYMVLREDSDPPTFLEVSAGGHFKGRDPTVAVSILEAKWVGDARTLYIGKANRLCRRIKQFVDFGAGRPVGHWGGRHIWQLADSSDLLIAWRPCAAEESARRHESDLLMDFGQAFAGRLPFANLVR